MQKAVAKSEHSVKVGLTPTNETIRVKRLFFALWPDAETRQCCADVSAACKRVTGREVHPENLHVTLTFLGGIDEPTEAALIMAAAEVEFDPMSIKFDKLSYWRRPRIICLTGEPEDSAVINLVEKLNAIAASLGIGIDTRPFQAHVTLIRKASKLPAITFEPIFWKADAFCLVESCSTPEGVVYRVLKTWSGMRATNTIRIGGASTKTAD
jgi:RNA 2',3'-cyclic 3'-phosphodiesterase